MSVRVDPDDLLSQLQSFGVAPYLLTTSADLRPHTTHVVVRLESRELRATIGRKTAMNIAERAAVSLLWQPFELGGFSLIVDGDATVEPDGEDNVAVIHVTAAVLHRNAAPDAGYLADCEVLDGRHD